MLIIYFIDYRELIVGPVGIRFEVECNPLSEIADLWSIEPIFLIWMVGNCHIMN
jgi:hypothetical protein